MYFFQYSVHKTHAPKYTFLNVHQCVTHSSFSPSDSLESARRCPRALHNLIGNFSYPSAREVWREISSLPLIFKSLGYPYVETARSPLSQFIQKYHSSFKLNQILNLCKTSPWWQLYDYAWMYMSVFVDVCECLFLFFLSPPLQFHGKSVLRLNFIGYP